MRKMPCISMKQSLAQSFCRAFLWFILTAVGGVSLSSSGQTAEDAGTVEIASCRVPTVNDLLVSGLGNSICSSQFLTNPGSLDLFRLLNYSYSVSKITVRRLRKKFKDFGWVETDNDYWLIVELPDGRVISDQFTAGYGNFLIFVPEHLWGRIGYYIILTRQSGWGTGASIYDLEVLEPTEDGIKKVYNDRVSERYFRLTEDGSELIGYQYDTYIKGRVSNYAWTGEALEFVLSPTPEGRITDDWKDFPTLSCIYKNEEEIEILMNKGCDTVLK